MPIYLCNFSAYFCPQEYSKQKGQKQKKQTKKKKKIFFNVQVILKL